MKICVTYKMDEDGNPVECPDLVEWNEWVENNNRKIAETFIGDIIISTVFLRCMIDIDINGNPICFETMIFGGEHDQYQDHYTTKKLALMGHALACQMVEESLSKNKE